MLKERGSAKGKGQRIPAASLEAHVTNRIRTWLADGGAVLEALRHFVPDATAQRSIVAAAAHLAASWPNLRSNEIRGLLLTVCPRVQVHEDQVEITIDRPALAKRLQLRSANGEAPKPASAPDAEDPLVLTVPARLRRAGKEMRMVVDDGSEPANVDTGLVRILLRAFAMRDRVFDDTSLSLSDIAEREGFTASYATRVFRLSFLAPDIVAAILDGRQPPDLTARKLLDDTRLSLDWSDQRAKLGFG